MYELVHCVPSIDGVGRFSLFQNRMRFAKYVHAFVFAQRSKKVPGIHYAILRGTRAAVAAMPGCISQAKLADFVDQSSDDEAPPPPTPDQYRFGVAIVDAKSGVRVCDEIDGEPMRYVTRDAAERVLEFAKRRLLLPNYAATGCELRVVPVNGMDDFKFEEDCAAQLKEWKKGVKE